MVINRTIAVAGIPRSGSTWQFNAARLLIEDAGIDHWSGWIEDFGDTRAPVKLVLIPEPVRQKPGVEGDGGFNPVSLLHPGHIRTEGESQDHLGDIVAWIADLD